ncbi:MAG: hypothetical protein WBA74_18780 [Cyclobacteriaceae bacterium]
MPRGRVLTKHVKQNKIDLDNFNTQNFDLKELKEFYKEDFEVTKEQILDGEDSKEVSFIEELIFSHRIDNEKYTKAHCWFIDSPENITEDSVTTIRPFNHEKALCRIVLFSHTDQLNIIVEDKSTSIPRVVEEKKEIFKNTSFMIKFGFTSITTLFVDHKDYYITKNEKIRGSRSKRKNKYPKNQQIYVVDIYM